MGSRNRVSAAVVGVVGTALAVGLGGCVNQQQYDRLNDLYLASQDQNTQLTRELEQLRDSLDLTQTSNSGTQVTLEDLRRENAQLRTRLDETNKFIAEMDGQIRNLALIDPKFDQALRRLAAQYPNVIIYDAERGVLRFASDLTFASGSDQVRDAAAQTLRALADVLKTQTTTQYELEIVGHTDAEPISSGTAQRHPTNMHLSVHRSIAVKQQLVSMGVPADRVLVAGWGESKPAVANNPGGNTPQNRRVEIFFKPERDSLGATATAPADTRPVYTEPTK
jgi:chemotaxis protein MotB